MFRMAGTTTAKASIICNSCLTARTGSPTHAPGSPTPPDLRPKAVMNALALEHDEKGGIRATLESAIQKPKATCEPMTLKTRTVLLVSALLLGGCAHYPVNAPIPFESFETGPHSSEEMSALLEKGDPVAQYRFGECCLHGWGVPMDPAAAEKWFRKAAE